MSNRDNVKIRPYTDKDLQAVRSLHERFGQFPLPNLADPHYIVSEVAESDGQIVGLGCIRTTAEVMSIVDRDKDILTRAAIVDELLRVGIHKSQKFGVDELHAFLTGVDA